MQEHGVIENIEDAIVCQTNDIFEGDFVSDIAIGFSETDLIQFFYSTRNQVSAFYALEPQEDPTLVFSPVLTFGQYAKRLFYGFLGRSSPT